MLIERNQSGILLIDTQEKLLPLVQDAEDCGRNCKTILQIAQLLNIPIITAQQYPEKLGATVASLQPWIQSHALINKLHFSAYADPEGKKLIDAYQKKQWVLIGIETHVCVLQTAFDLKAAGFEVFVVLSATSTRDTLDKQTAVSRMLHEGITPVTLEMLVFEWIRRAGTDEFKEVYQKFKEILFG